MDPLDTNTHAFLVRLWLEETEQEDGRTTWRGHITHVADGERRYVKKLDDITTFIMPYLQSVGVRFGWWWRIKQWIKQQRRLLEKRKL